jgi:two-component system, LytTR family, response regulator
MKLFIIDDEDHVRASITTMLNLYYKNAEIVGSCSSINTAVPLIHERQPDVVMLDVEVGKESGFDLFNYFSQPNFKIIFITAYQHYALQAFRFSALDYLLKPIEPDLMVAALEKAKHTLDSESLTLKISSFLSHIDSPKKQTKKIVLKTAESVFVVNITDIIYCEADRSYTSFYLVDKSRIVVSTSLGEYEDLLVDFNFLRVHQSYLANLEYVKRYEKHDGGRLIFKNEAAVPVATRKREVLLQQLSKL